MHTHPDTLDAVLLDFERTLATIAPPPLAHSPRYDLDIARHADDLACALAGITGHRAPLAFHEIAQRDTDLAGHRTTARHRAPGAPCADVLRARRPQNPTDTHTSHHTSGATR